MSVAVLVLLAVVGGLPSAGVLLAARLPGLGGRTRGWALPAFQVVGLAVAGLLAARAAPVGPTTAGLAQVLAVLAAGGGASPVVRAGFRVARRTGPPGAPTTELLRGGAVIGVLERAAVAVTLLAGFPDGLAVVLAIKGLARYPELRDARAGEQFIIGTFTSVLWALACWATAHALLG